MIVSSDVNNIMFESEAHTERGSPSLVGVGVLISKNYLLTIVIVSVLRVLQSTEEKKC
jgi:hypothetical protein